MAVLSNYRTDSRRAAGIRRLRELNARDLRLEEEGLKMMEQERKRAAREARKAAKAARGNPWARMATGAISGGLMGLASGNPFGAALGAAAGAGGGLASYYLQDKDAHSAAAMQNLGPLAANAYGGFKNRQEMNDRQARVDALYDSFLQQRRAQAMPSGFGEVEMTPPPLNGGGPNAFNMPEYGAGAMPPLWLGASGAVSAAPVQSPYGYAAGDAASPTYWERER